MINLFSTRMPRHLNGEKNSNFTNGSSTAGYSHARIKFDLPPFHAIYKKKKKKKIDSKRIISRRKS